MTTNAERIRKVRMAESHADYAISNGDREGVLNLLALLLVSLGKDEALLRKISYIETLSRCCQLVGKLVRYLDEGSGDFRIIPGKHGEPRIPMFELSDHLVSPAGEYPHTVLYETVLSALAARTQVIPEPSLSGFSMPDSVPSITGDSLVIETADPEPDQAPEGVSDAVWEATMVAEQERYRSAQALEAEATFIAAPDAGNKVSTFRTHLMGARTGKNTSYRQGLTQWRYGQIPPKLRVLLEAIYPLESTRAALWWHLFTDLWTVEWQFFSHSGYKSILEPGIAVPPIPGGDLGSVLDGVRIQSAFVMHL